MAEAYDPAGPSTLDDGADTNGSHDRERDGQSDGAAEEDDDYDPSAGFAYGEGNDQHFEQTSAEQTPQHALAPAPKQTEQTTKPPQTVAGFVLEESDDEQEESAPTPSQLSGDDAGALAASQAPDVSLRSAPQDTATPSTSLNGSAAVPVPASTLSVPDSSSSLQPPVADSGKHAVSPVASAVPTPQPEANGLAAAPQTVPQTNGSLVTAPTARLPHDKVGQLEDRIKDDPKGDTDAWLTLIKHYYDKGQYQGSRDVYKRFFEVFPTAVSMWVRYVQMENELDERDNVVHILNASVMAVPSVDLWKLYLDHVRRALPLMNDADGKNRSEITKAFEVTLDNVGIDPDAGLLWREYIDFLLSGPGTVGGQSWQDLQKVDMLRKAYQRSIKLPHHESMRLWKEYETFEMGLHKATGRKHVQEQSPHYMQARTARMQLEQRLEGLDRKSLPKLPPVYGCAGDDEFGTQVEKWRGWIEWERDEDPLVYRGTEDEAYRQRVLYAYKQATLCLCFYPDIWFEAVNWCFAQGIDAITAEGEQLLDKAIANNPESVLLAMLRADRVEASLETGNTDEVLCRNGDKLDAPYENVHTALYALRTKLKEKDDKALAQISTHYASLPPEDEQMDGDEEDDNRSDKPKTRDEQKKADIDAVKAASAAQMDILKRTISYVWVAKMRAFRRVQGQGKPLKKGDNSSKVVKGFRGIFSDARPRGPLSSDVYIASALMEWRCYKDPSAIKIFERGMKLFPLDEAFILEYVKHLITLSDVTNARVVFESTIPKICNAADFTLEQKREKCRPLITYMHDYESKYGDLAQIHKIEKRMAELYPEEPEISRFSHRFSLPNFDAMHVQLILSPTQALPKAYQPLPLEPIQQVTQAQASIENHMRSPKGPEILLGPNGPYVASPKRPLEDSDTDSPRKFLRGESPLKGAAGVRIQTKQAAAAGGGGGFATKTFVPNSAPLSIAPPQLPPAIDAMLRRLPGSNSYFQVRFDAAKLAMLLPTVNVENASAQFAATGNIQRQF